MDAGASGAVIALAAWPGNARYSFRRAVGATAALRPIEASKAEVSKARLTSRAVLVRAAGGERHRSSCPEREPQPVVRQQWPLQRERLRWRRLKLAFGADYILGFDGDARGPE